jgi:hypothetical protein
VRKLAIKSVAAVTVFSAVLASAATLGGVTTDKIGAEDATIAACDSNGVTTSYTSSWDSTDKRYEIATVTVKGVADTCDGQTLKVTLADTTGVSLSEGTLTIPASVAVDHAVTLATPVSTESTSAVHANIS